MATRLYPFLGNMTGAGGPDNDFPWWALFEDDDDQTRQSCSGAARRECNQQREPQPSTSAAAYGPKPTNRGTSAGGLKSNPNPHEFLTNIAGAFLPGLFEAVAAAGAGTGAAKANTEATSSASTPADAGEFLSTAAAFASTYFPEFYDALTGGNKKEEVLKPAAATASAAPVPASSNSNNGFEAKLNVSDFTPEELSVKTIDNTIVIEGKQQEKEDDQGFVSRSFSRRFVIPDNVKPESVECKLTTDGFLVLSAPRIVEAPATSERSIPIAVSASDSVAPKVEDMALD